ncbi:MAG: hypothetical protein RL391_1948 [Actinomycetota bacterium]
MGKVEDVLDRLPRWLHLAVISVMACAVGALSGVGSWALFEALDAATDTRLGHDWLVWLLPIAALVLGLAYHYAGGDARRGTSLVIGESLPPDDPSAPETTPAVPRRMAPMIFGATYIAQLTGASVGREGAALQIGGSLTSLVLRPFRLGAHDRRLMLVAAMAGAFGGAFGVPMAGAVFALEVQRTGRLRYESLAPALVASVAADRVVEALGRSTPLVDANFGDVDLDVLWRLAIVGLACGLAARAFIMSHHWVKQAIARVVGYLPARPVIGAVATLALMALFGRDYLGLSLPLVENAIAGNSADWWEPVLKIVFTAIALGSGIPGGEVTPLFVVGATLGSALASPLGLDPRLAAMAALPAAFGAAANTPIACALLAIELFGGSLALPAALVCIVAFAVSPDRGIYEGQRIGSTKDLRASAARPPHA